MEGVLFLFSNFVGTDLTQGRCIQEDVGHKINLAPPSNSQLDHCIWEIVGHNHTIKTFTDL